MPQCAKVTHHTHTHVARFGNTTGFSVPMPNPNHVEEEVWHALKNIPEHVATTFHSPVVDIKMNQDSHCADSEAWWDAVDGQLDHLTGLLQMLVGLKSSKGGRKAKAGKVFSQHFEPANTVLIMLGITASTSSPSLHTNCDAFLSITDVSPPIQSFPPSTAPMPNITINISNLSANSGSAYTVTQSKHPLTTSSCSNLTPNPQLQSSCIPKY